MSPRPAPAGPVRRPAVAGAFYAAEPARLEADVRGYLGGGGAPEPCVAVVVPHAGYVYSGAVAGATYARAAIPRRVVVLAVNHRGLGARLATWTEGAWETPLGAAPVDGELVAAIRRRSPRLEHDPGAHAREHSLEVQLPFLQVAGPSGLRFAPVSIASHDLGELEALGRAVAAAVREAGEPVLVVASTDFTHYEDAASARAKDEVALACIRAVDGPGLLRTVLERGLTMCGVAPTTAALVAARELGAREAVLVRYANSGDVSGDFDSVVGYAGLVLPATAGGKNA